MIKQIIFIQFIFIQIAFAQSYGSLRITNYANDKKSAFSLTFDDGLKTQYDYVKPILDQYGFKGTFYILPPFLVDSNQGTIWRYGTWNEFQQLAEDDNEIGSHTMNHDTLTTLEWGDTSTSGTLLYELYQSKKSIEQKIPDKKCISFNYPYTIRNSIVDSAAKLFYENARTGGEAPNNFSLSGNDWYKLKAKEVKFNDPRDSVTDDLDELYTFLEWLQNSIDNKKWGMIIIHDVLPFSELEAALNDDVYEPVTTEWLTWLCEFLTAKSSSKDIWVETVGNIMRYIKEREASTYQIISSSDSLIEIILTDTLDNEVYNYPLSVYVNIPDDWYYVSSEQNGSVDTLTTTLTDSGRVVLVKVTPDKGYLKLSPLVATDVKNESNNLLDYHLSQNYPNPFNPNTKISWQTQVTGLQTIKVFDVLGREIVTLINEIKPAGNYEINFDASNLSSGVYYYQLRAGDFIQTRKMILIK